MKFQSDPLHRQGTSAKRDLIGGYIERWFNKIAETVVFENLLKNKDYKIVPDYFLYSNDTEKNAPDILGLEKKGGEIIPFVKYNNGTWEVVGEMPRIEVKVVRVDQSLLSVREPQMIDDFYVFVESDLEGDYLTAIFENEVFSDENFSILKPKNDFIANDKDSKLITPLKVSKTEKIGTLRLLGIYTKEEVRKLFIYCDKNINPYYFASAENKEPWRPNSEEIVKLSEDGLFEYKYENEVYLPLLIQMEKPWQLKICKKNKGSVVLESSSDLNINGVRLNKGYVTVNFNKFERSSKWDENIASKYLVQGLGKDSTENLIEIFDKIISQQ